MPEGIKKKIIGKIPCFICGETVNVTLHESKRGYFSYMIQCVNCIMRSFINGEEAMIELRTLCEKQIKQETSYHAAQK